MFVFITMDTNKCSRIARKRLSRRVRDELKRESKLLQLHRFCDTECDHDVAAYQRTYGEVSVPVGSVSVTVDTVVLAKTSAIGSLHLLHGEIYTGPPTPRLRHSQSIAVNWLDGDISSDEFQRYSDYMSEVVACRACGVEIPNPPELPHIQLIVSEPGTPSIPLADYLSVRAPIDGSSFHPDLSPPTCGCPSNVDVDSSSGPVLETFSSLRFNFEPYSEVVPAVLSDRPSDLSNCSPSDARKFGYEVKMSNRIASHLALLPGSDFSRYILAERVSDIRDDSGSLVYNRYAVDVDQSVPRGHGAIYSDLRAAPASFDCGISLFTIRRTFPLRGSGFSSPSALIDLAASVGSLLPTYPDFRLSGSILDRRLTYVVSTVALDDHG